MTKRRPKDEHTGTLEPTIRRGRVDSLTLYEITDNELEILERGSPGSTELNFAVALLSIFSSSLTTLLTTTTSTVVFQFFLMVTIVTFVLGSFFLIKWKRTHNDVKDVVARIKARVADAPALTTSNGMHVDQNGGIVVDPEQAG